MIGFCQLAADWLGDIPTGGMMAERKHDGWRALRFPGIDGQVRLWTRGGHPIGGVGHILERLAFMEQVAGEELMFDGEFVVDGTLEATKRWCERGWKLGGEDGVLRLFDAMPLADWRAGGCDTPLYQRKARLKALLSEPMPERWEWRAGSRGEDDPTCVQLVEDGWVFDAGHVVAEVRRAWAVGEEGLVLKDPEAPYLRRRTSAWQKVKRGPAFVRALKRVAIAA